MIFSRTVFLFIILIPIGSWANEGLTIAVASNFQRTAAKLAAEFTSVTQTPIRISAASTGNLYNQIINGAPYDIFLAADVERPKRLEDNEFTVVGSRMTYATGALVLWSSDSSFEDGGCAAAIKGGSYRKLAIANPEIAPYGLAAKEYLQAIGSWRDASSRMVFGENISQTLLFAVTGNVTFALVARAQVVAGLPVDATCTWNVPSSMHSDIEQQGVLLTHSKNLESAWRFMRFLREPRAIKIIESSGYTVTK
ncbi:MAG: molybdate ABC transporter substrate-binding protein [Woeseiaceae bacterium]|nr:molybdate ABC transporter substrate-binding protein [Woeseiaceae bacterium]